MFALLGITMHDALLTSFTGKFVYGLWRPTTAIRAADLDGNAATETDPTFVSLIPTPPHPSYPGNMACIGSSSSTVYTMLWGRDDIPFSVTWTGVGQSDVTRSYSGRSADIIGRVSCDGSSTRPTACPAACRSPRKHRR